MTEQSPPPTKSKQASRDGKRSLTIWLDADLARNLKIAAARHDKTQEAIVTEGVKAMLKQRYKP